MPVFPKVLVLRDLLTLHPVSSEVVIHGHSSKYYLHVVDSQISSSDLSPAIHTSISNCLLHLYFCICPIGIFNSLCLKQILSFLPNLFFLYPLQCPQRMLSQVTRLLKSNSASISTLHPSHIVD